MKLSIGIYSFKLKLWALCTYLCVLVIMLNLAFWQLGRADQKIAMQSAVETAQSSDAVPLRSISDVEEAANQYTRVTVEGHFDTSKQFLWDNRIHQGRAGYEVIVPLVTEDNQRVLVNRGWVPVGASRQQFPNVSLPKESLESKVTIEGVLSRPSRGFAGGEAFETDVGWPRLLQYFDYELINTEFGELVIPAVVQVQVVAADGSRIDVPTPRQEWLVANWQAASSGPEKHYSYAFQWFAMAFALTIIFIVTNTRKRALPATNTKVNIL